MYWMLANISSTSLQLVIRLFIFTLLMWIIVIGIWKLNLTFLEKSLLGHNVASFFCIAVCSLSRISGPVVHEGYWSIICFTYNILSAVVIRSMSVSSVAQSCPTLYDPMYCSMPDFPVHHQLPELTQTHVNWVSDAIQPSHPLSSPSPPAFNLSQYQGLL